MHKSIVTRAAALAVGIMALALGWFAHAAVPLSAQGTVAGGPASQPAHALAAATAGNAAHLTYQGRLTNPSGVPINKTVSVVFRLYDDGGMVLWTSATRSITPMNGLFTVYLGEDPDPDLQPNLDLTDPPASIGVTVDGDQEMLPRQPLNTLIGHGIAANQPGVFASSINFYGVIGESINSVGVVGSSPVDYGVLGASSSSAGVYGSSNSFAGVNGFSNSGTGVLGQTRANGAAGVKAEGASITGTALSISQGAFKVVGAGVGTSTPVFIQKVAVGGNICASKNYATVVNNPLVDGKPNAILIVTPNYGAVSGGSAPAVGTYGVFYDDTGTCGFGPGKWVIYLTDSAPVALTNNSLINVMVIVP